MYISTHTSSSTEYRRTALAQAAQHYITSDLHMGLDWQSPEPTEPTGQGIPGAPPVAK